MPNPQRQSSEEAGWVLHSTALSKMWVQGVCIAGCWGEILLFVPGQRKMQDATKIQSTHTHPTRDGGTGDAMDLPCSCFAKPGGEWLSTVFRFRQGRGGGPCSFEPWGRAQPAAQGSAGQRFPGAPCLSAASAATPIYDRGAGLDPTKYFAPWKRGVANSPGSALPQQVLECFPGCWYMGICRDISFQFLGSGSFRN